MTDLHKVVVDYVSKVIGWESIIFEDDLVVNVSVVKHDLSVHDILKRCFAFWNLHSDDV